MKTFAVVGARSNVADLLDVGYRNMLVSFANDKKGGVLDTAVGHDVTVMLDSGAFTAWTVGKHVDLAAFAAYAVTQRERFDDAVVVNLDIIPGTATAPLVTEREKRDATRQSAKNAEALRAYGLPVMEVYHLGEPVKVLEAILERRRPGERIALGGLARQRGGLGFPVKKRFCASVFATLRASYGDEIPSVHGLGIAPDGAIGGAVFPWGSMDCSSWLSIGQYGVGVRSDGKRLGGRSDKRVSGSKAMVKLYSSRVLKRWQALDASHSRLWDERGITVS